MRCGHCKERDVIIEHVRACALANSLPILSQGSHTVPPAQNAATHGGNPREPLPFPHGRYAVTMPDDKLHFYSFDAGKNRWEGYTFVKEQFSDDFVGIRDKGRRAEIIRRVAADPEEAMLRYGREIGKCGHCGRTLTNEESRRVGIGPVCRNVITF
jgi:hypothetical protein